MGLGLVVGGVDGTSNCSGSVSIATFAVCIGSLCDDD